MKTKLTLRMDEKLIQEAKRLAKERGESVSSLVASYFSLLISSSREMEESLPPITRSLYGIAAGSDLDERNYREYLEEKYL